MIVNHYDLLFVLEKCWEKKVQHYTVVVVAAKKKNQSLFICLTQALERNQLFIVFQQLPRRPPQSELLVPSS